MDNTNVSCVFEDERKSNIVVAMGVGACVSWPESTIYFTPITIVSGPERTILQ